MNKKPGILALIPARGGSKGIPRKNIRPLAGFPLIAYSIAAARQSELVSRVVVSTDDEEIAGIARSLGADVPFLRPAELAQDSSLDLPVFRHALKWLAEKEGWHPAAVVHLRPTTPFRPPDLVDRAIGILLDHPQADSVRSLTPAHQNPYKMWLMDGQEQPIHPLLLAPGVDESYNAPRQVLPAVYAHTGLIDVVRPGTILEMNSMSGRIILPVMFDAGYDIDLDTPADWLRAERRLADMTLPLVWPGSHKRPMPKKISLLVLDFDGVLTDNRVWVDQDGCESVAANRSDSLWINLLRARGVQVWVISRETNPVVAARCRKIGIPFIQGEVDKQTALQKLLQETGLEPASVVYCGNDINDLPCFPLVGWAAAVADAAPEVKQQADIVLQQRGGHGAVQELCRCILEEMGKAE